MIYCINKNCPFKDCDKHLSQLLTTQPDGRTIIGTAALDGTCRRYITWLVKSEVE